MEKNNHRQAIKVLTFLSHKRIALSTSSFLNLTDSRSYQKISWKRAYGEISRKRQCMTTKEECAR
ncbi:hypothetical protein ACTXT7_010533 [Hymenolepis weldensis]